MKKINKYYLNEGMGGIILAKSLKQAVKKVVYVYRPNTVKTIINNYKKCKKIDCWEDTEYFMEIEKVAKKGENRKSQLVGFSNY